MVVNLQQETATAPAAHASAEKASPTSQKRDVYLTGFDKFGDILENPTSSLAKNLTEHPKVTEARVLEVSIKNKIEISKWTLAVCLMAGTFYRLCGRLGRYISTKLGVLKKRGRPCIFLHFGVSATTRSLLLEKVGYNVANFRIPDKQGYVAKGEIICEGEPYNIETTLPLEEMLKTLQTVHPQIEISTDPGRYICNFVYYRSLVWVKRQNSKGFPNHLALFVHVPKFRSVNFEAQFAIASKIVDIVADL